MGGLGEPGAIAGHWPRRGLSRAKANRRTPPAPVACRLAADPLVRLRQATDGSGWAAGDRRLNQAAQPMITFIQECQCSPCLFLFARFLDPWKFFFAGIEQTLKLPKNHSRTDAALHDAHARGLAAVLLGHALRDRRRIHNGCAQDRDAARAAVCPCRCPCRCEITPRWCFPRVARTTLGPPPELRRSPPPSQGAVLCPLCARACRC